MRSLPSRPGLPLVFGVLLGASCSGGAEAPPTVASGPKAAAVSFGTYAFRDTIGTLFPGVPVQVTDAAGRPVAGVTVRWSTPDSAGVVTPTTSVTDASGVARTQWQLGLKSGYQALVATVAGLPPDTAHATVATGLATIVTLAPARVVIGAVGDSVPVTVAVSDRGGNKFSGLALAAASVGPEVAQLVGTGQGATRVVATAWGTGAVAVRVPGTSAQASLSVEAPAYATVWTNNARTCAAAADGALACWGDNVFGLFGDGTTAARPSPGPVLAGAVAVRAGLGRQTLCIVAATGEAQCAGLNDYGELGDGSVPSPRPTFAPVMGGYRFVDLSTGHTGSCALTAAGAAYCWGMDALGQLGRDSTFGMCQAYGATCARTPVKVGGDRTFARVWMSQAQTACGLTAAGAAYCWGDDTFGQLGADRAPGPCGAPGAGFLCLREPAPVGGGLRFATLAPGYHLTCGLAAGGEAYCWGQRAPGVQSGTPIRAAPGLTFTDMQTGGDGVCGLTADGAVYCWGGSLGLTPQRHQTAYAFAALAVGAAGDGSDLLRICGVVRGRGVACQAFTANTAAQSRAPAVGMRLGRP